MRNLLLVFIFAFFATPALAQETPVDGTYDATVTTDSGTYSVPVDVEDGEVTYVHWPNGGDMHVYGAEIDDSGAYGSNSRGDSINVEIDDLEYEGEE